MKTLRIGSVHTLKDGTKLTVVKSDAISAQNLCDGCYFFHPEMFGGCTAQGDFANCGTDRSDNEDVIYVQSDIYKNDKNKKNKSIHK